MIPLVRHRAEDWAGPGRTAVLLVLAVLGFGSVGSGVAVALASILPFPPELVSHLLPAIERREAGEVRAELEEALANTGTGVSARRTSPTTDLSASFGEEIWALTRQTREIVPDDLPHALRLELADYYQQGGGSGWYELTRKLDAAEPLASLLLTAVSADPSRPGFFRQTLTIRLRKEACITLDALRARFMPPPPEPPSDPPTVVVTGTRLRADRYGQLEVPGDRSGGPDMVFSSFIEMGSPGCMSDLTIEKLFSQEARR